MASAYLSRSITTSTDNTRFTISVWVKKLKQVSNSYQNIINSRQSGTTNGLGLWFGDNDEIFYNFGTSSSASSACQTNAKYRDNSAWYHIVLAGDASQSGTDKLKFYVNGEQITSFQTDNRSSFATIEYDLGNTTYPTLIGRKHDDTFHFDGCMAHFHFVDGTAYQASTFGETDATTGIWKPKTAPSVTYGTNGFFLKFENSGAMGTDSSGNSNNFSVGGGTMTQLIDTPSNVFATWNPLVITSAGGVAVRTPAFQNGNTTALFDDSGNNEFAISTLAPSKGKYYAEFKWVNATGNAASTVGIVKSDFAIQTDVNDQGVVYKGDGNKVVNNSSSSYGASWTTGDIIAIVLDCDSNTVNFYKNNAPQGSISIDADTNWYMFCSSYALSSVTRSVNANFGNGYFGTTAITSAGSNGNGSLFEYDVPSGYYALNTKNINTYG